MMGIFALFCFDFHRLDDSFDSHLNHWLASVCPGTSLRRHFIQQYDGEDCDQHHRSTSCVYIADNNVDHIHRLWSNDDTVSTQWNGDNCPANHVSQNDTSSTLDSILRAVGNIVGPFAFVHIDTQLCLAVFGRDQLGRRSLVFSYSPSLGAMILSSSCYPLDDFTAPSTADMTDGNYGGWEDWKEVNVDGIFTIALNSETDLSNGPPMELHSWQDSLFNLTGRQHILNPREATASSVHADNLPEFYSSPEYMQIVKQFMNELENAVSRIVSRTANYNSQNCTIGVLFSGGIDSVVVTALACKCAPEHVAIDLLNVSFDGNSAADRRQGTSAFEELR